MTNVIASKAKQSRTPGDNWSFCGYAPRNDDEVVVARMSAATSGTAHPRDKNPDIATLIRATSLACLAMRLVMALTARWTLPG